MKIRSQLLLASSMFCVSMIVPVVAMAQDASNATEKRDETNAEEDKAQIIVTGSRIKRPNLNSTVPITTVEVEDLIRSSNISIGDALNDLPALRSTFSSQNSGRFIGTAGINTLDLRGLGGDRTLVLVNGRRHVTSSPGSFTVDTNTIPSDLVERVDIVTGGNSAIYGSDAIAGVVNFVTKTNYDGFRLNAQAGISKYGDRGSHFIGGVAGKNFSDGRGNIAIALEYADQSPLFQTDRARETGAFTGVPGFVQTQRTFFGATDPRTEGTPTNPGDGISDTTFFGPGGPGITFSNVGLGGSVATICPAASPALAARIAAVCTGQLSPTGGRLSDNYFFQPDGTLLRNNPILDFRPVGGSVLGGRGATGVEGAQLSVGLKRYSANILAKFEISPAFIPFFEGKYVRIDSSQTSTQPTFTSGTLSAVFNVTNPFLSAQALSTLRTILPVGATTFSMIRFNNDIGTRAEDHKRETIRFVGGVRGDISEKGNLSYEVALNYGKTTRSYETGGNVLVANFNKAANAVRNGAGNIVCAVNADAITTNDDPACVPLNLFGQGAPSIEAQKYIIHTSRFDAKATQYNATAFVSGDTSGLFELPGGPIGLAFGGEYRKEDAFSKYDDITASGATFLNAIAAFDPPYIELKETFGEIRLPIIKDSFIKELTLEASGRYSDYNRTGGVVAYNFGGTFAPIDDVRFRVGYARSVRAPNLVNLFATQSETFANGLVDPCSQTVIRDDPNRVRNCAAAGIPTTILVAPGDTRPWTNTSGSGVSGFNQGNINLKPEVAKSLTAGFIFQPSFVPGFALSVDYYKITLRQAISGLSGQTIINRCYDDPVGLDNPFCAAVFRRSSPDPLVNGTFNGQTTRTFVGVADTILAKLGPAFLNQPFNYQKFQRNGIDFDLSYRKKFDDLQFSARAIGTYVIKSVSFTSITDPNFAQRAHSTLGDPRFSANFTVSVDSENFGITYNGRYVGRQTIGAYETQFSFQGRPPSNFDAFPTPYYPSQFYHNIRLEVRPSKQFEFYAGVDNVRNSLPPFGLTGTGDGGGVYSNVGRFFFAGVSVNY